MKPGDKEQPAEAQRSRKQIGYWAEFNSWWRLRQSELGRRPVKKEVEEWYGKHAESTWQDESTRPSFRETQEHAKCLRSTEEVKQYFRKYRAGRRQQQNTEGEAEEQANKASELLSQQAAILLPYMATPGAYEFSIKQEDGHFSSPQHQRPQHPQAADPRHRAPQHWLGSPPAAASAHSTPGGTSAARRHSFCSPTNASRHMSQGSSMSTESRSTMDTCHGAAAAGSSHNNNASNAGPHGASRRFTISTGSGGASQLPAAMESMTVAGTTAASAHHHSNMRPPYFHSASKAAVSATMPPPSAAVRAGEKAAGSVGAGGSGKLRRGSGAMTESSEQQQQMPPPSSCVATNATANGGGGGSGYPSHPSFSPFMAGFDDEDEDLTPRDGDDSRMHDNNDSSGHHNGGGSNSNPGARDHQGHHQGHQGHRQPSRLGAAYSYDSAMRTGDGSGGGAASAGGLPMRFSVPRDHQLAQLAWQEQRMHHHQHQAPYPPPPYYRPGAMPQGYMPPPPPPPTQYYGPYGPCYCPQCIYASQQAAAYGGMPMQLPLPPMHQSHHHAAAGGSSGGGGYWLPYLPGGGTLSDTSGTYPGAGGAAGPGHGPAAAPPWAGGSSSAAAAPAAGTHNTVSAPMSTIMKQEGQEQQQRQEGGTAGTGGGSGADEEDNGGLCPLPPLPASAYSFGGCPRPRSTGSGAALMSIGSGGGATVTTGAPRPYCPDGQMPTAMSNTDVQTLTQMCLQAKRSRDTARALRALSSDGDSAGGGGSGGGFGDAVGSGEAADTRAAMDGAHGDIDEDDEDAAPSKRRGHWRSHRRGSADAGKASNSSEDGGSGGSGGAGAGADSSDTDSLPGSETDQQHGARMQPPRRSGSEVLAVVTVTEQTPRHPSKRPTPLEVDDDGDEVFEKVAKTPTRSPCDIPDFTLSGGRSRMATPRGGFGGFGFGDDLLPLPFGAAAAAAAAAGGIGPDSPGCSGAVAAAAVHRAWLAKYAISNSRDLSAVFNSPRNAGFGSPRFGPGADANVFSAAISAAAAAAAAGNENGGNGSAGGNGGVAVPAIDSELLKDYMSMDSLKHSLEGLMTSFKMSVSTAKALNDLISW